jgi:hypothetical protein
LTLFSSFARPTRRGIGLLAIALYGAACHLIVGIDDHTFRVVTPDASISEERFCAHAARPPGPPTGATANEQTSIVFAMRTADISGTYPDKRPAGYDLDGVCTCDPRDRSAKRGRHSCTPPRSPGGHEGDGGCDYDGGVDNAQVDPVAGIAIFAGETNNIETQANCGRTTLLIVLSRYNGTDNDSEVAVGLVVSYGLYDVAPRTDAATASCPKNSKWQPGDPFGAEWDGNDRWSPRPGDLVAGTSNPSFNFNGWVTDGVLVVDTVHRPQEQDKKVNIVFGGAVLAVDSPVMSARITSTGGKYRLSEGILTGRTTAADALNAVGTIETPNGRRICDESSIFEVLRRAVCEVRDSIIPADRDFRDEPCNALSVVLRFEAEKASLSTEERAGDGRPRPPCLDGGSICGD